MKAIYLTSSLRLGLSKPNDSVLVACEQLYCAPPLMRKNLTFKQNMLRAFCIPSFNRDGGIKKLIPEMDMFVTLGESDGIAAGILWSLANEKYSPKAEDTDFSI